LFLPASPRPKKLLVVTVTKGFRHSSIPTAEKVLGELAQKSGAFTVDYVRTDEDMAQKMTPEALRNYDGVMFANPRAILPLPDKQAFLDWIKSGKGFIATHSGSDTFHGFSSLHRDARRRVRDTPRPGPGDCINQDPKHPACRHLEPTWHLKDENLSHQKFLTVAKFMACSCLDKTSE